MKSRGLMVAAMVVSIQWSGPTLGVRELLAADTAVSTTTKRMIEELSELGKDPSLWLKYFDRGLRLSTPISIPAVLKAKVQSGKPKPQEAKKYNNKKWRDSEFADLSIRIQRGEQAADIASLRQISQESSHRAAALNQLITDAEIRGDKKLGKNKIANKAKVGDAKDYAAIYELLAARAQLRVNALDPIPLDNRRSFLAAQQDIAIRTGFEGGLASHLQTLNGEVRAREARYYSLAKAINNPRIQDIKGGELMPTRSRGYVPAHKFFVPVREEVEKVIGQVNDIRDHEIAPADDLVKDMSSQMRSRVSERLSNENTAFKSQVETSAQMSYILGVVQPALDSASRADSSLFMVGIGNRAANAQQYTYPQTSASLRAAALQDSTHAMGYIVAMNRQIASLQNDPRIDKDILKPLGVVDFGVWPEDNEGYTIRQEVVLPALAALRLINKRVEARLKVSDDFVDKGIDQTILEEMEQYRLRPRSRVPIRAGGDHDDPKTM